MGTGRWPGLPRLRRAARRNRARGKTGGRRAADEQTPAAEEADHETAELTSHYWRIYDERIATVKFSDVYEA